MDVHRPGEVRSLRDFVKEVAIIVLGVLIALAGEEAVQWLTWRHEVAIVKDSLDDELSYDLFAALERVKIADCQRQTLDRLDELADTSRDTLVVRNAPVTRNRIWASSAWEAAAASGTLAHMKHDTRNAYANLFAFMPLFRQLNVRQEELWATINAYRRPRRLTETSRERFVEAVSQLRALTGTMNLAARQFVDQAKPLNIQLDPHDAAALRQPLSCPLP